MSFPVVHFVFGGVEAASAGMGRPYTVVFDGQCKVCTRLAGVLRKWDAKNELEVIPFQNTSVLTRFPWIPSEAYGKALQLVGPGGKTWQGGHAIEQLLNILPLGGAIGWVFKIPYFGEGFERFYRWFAANRYRFGCGEHCQLRPADLDFGDVDDPSEKLAPAGDALPAKATEPVAKGAP
jgi:predicted DCC family thiol-disulfide oxidoreductase YuxK